MSLSVSKPTSSNDTAASVAAEVEATQPASHFYRVVWRWHFYAGLFVVPFMVMLALTGIIYLFKPQLDALMYRSLLFVPTTATESLPPSQLVAAAQAAHPDATVTTYRTPEAADRSAQVTVVPSGGGKLLVFVNPYTGEVLGERDEDRTLQSIAVKMHGELLIGTTGDRLIELAASWGLVLVVTGLYLWWPRKGGWVWGVLLPRLRGKRLFWRDMHAVVGFWGALLVAFMILTGLPWTGFWGEQFAQVWNRYPAHLWADVPLSTQLTGSLNDETTKVVPWAAEVLPLPESDGEHATHGTGDGSATEPTQPVAGVAAGVPVNVDSVVALAVASGAPAGFTVSLPGDETGVYTIAAAPNQPQGQMTLHIDQYSGQVLADIRWAQYGLVPKAVELGISLHEGRYFGLANQLLMLGASLVILTLALSGVILWWQRRPAGRLGVPTMPANFPLWKGGVAIIVGMALLFPLVALSLLVVLTLDFLLLSRVPALRQVLG